MKKITLLFFSIIYLSISLYAQREQDSLALVKFYEATGGNNWENNTNWLSSEPISTWRGVTITENRVQKLTFFSNNLDGTLPVEIGNLSALTNLVIIGNPLLTGNLPNEIGNLTELNQLVLPGNGFSGNIPTSIGNLTKLKELTLSENQFTGTIPTEIGNLSSLEELILGENELSDPIPATIGNLTTLTLLNLLENNFSGALFPEIVNLTALERIYLSDNEFTSLVDFSGFPNLRYLGINGNMLDFEDLELTNIDQTQVSVSYEDQKIELSISETISGTEHTLNALYTYTGTTYQWEKDDEPLDNETNASLIVPEANIGVYNYKATHPNWLDLSLSSECIIIGDLHGGVILSDSLALVDIYNNLDGENWHTSYYSDYPSHNWLSSEPLTRWTGVTIADGRVISLYLESMILTGEIPSTIGDLDALTYLNLRNNKLTGTIPTEIGNLTKLTDLYLDYNELSGTIPAEIGNLNQITFLRLSYNLFSGDLPAEIANLNLLETLYLSGNELTGLTDLTNLTSLINLSISRNLLDFEDLEVAKIDWTTDGFYYSPQNYQLPFTELINDSNISLTVNYDFSGTGYQWYKDKQIMPDETSKTLSLTSSDLGVFQCKANHANFPSLTLETEAYINGELHGGVFLSDSLALVAFYNATNGDNWTNNTNWLSTEPIEDWYNVVVENGRVASLSGSNNNLTGTLPPEIGDLNYLDKLYLYNNQIGGEIPEEVGNLINVSGLYLYQNNFSGSIPTSFGNLSNAYDIHIQSNNLTGEIPSEIGNIEGLHRFYAYDNLLSGAVPTSFGQLSEVYVLYLSNNQLSGSLPAEIANMSSLKYFIINDNELNDLPDLSSLPELAECKVYNNLLDFEALDNANIDWVGNSYYRYNDQNLILPVLNSNDGTNYTFEVDYTYAGVSYQWYKNDVLIDGETNQSFSFPISELGHYYCLVDYSSLPDLTLKSETIFISTVGIEKPEAFVSKVFPNPTRDYLKIQLEKPLENNAFLQLKDLSGNTVLSQSVGNEKQIELQLKHLSTGVYFLQISNDKDLFVQKIIVE